MQEPRPYIFCRKSYALCLLSWFKNVFCHCVERRANTTFKYSSFLIRFECCHECRPERQTSTTLEFSYFCVFSERFAQCRAERQASSTFKLVLNDVRTVELAQYSQLFNVVLMSNVQCCATSRT